jgi:hypothetical protein
MEEYSQYYRPTKNWSPARTVALTLDEQWFLLGSYYFIS